MKKKRPSEIEDTVLFEVCESFFKGKSTTKIAEEQRLKDIDIGREQVYPMLRIAIERGILRLCAPREHTFEEELSLSHPHVNFRVVNARGPGAVKQVASAGAELVFSLIRRLGERQKIVHLGLAPGYSVKLLCQDLSRLMKAETKLPKNLEKLALHSLSSGISIEDPTAIPLAFFPFFEDIAIETEFIGLFSSPMVRWDEYEETLRTPGIQEAFDKRDSINIIVISMAQSDDDDGLYRCFFESIGRASVLETLEDAGWLGEVHWHPFSRHGPLDHINTEVRAVTLFELDELRELASNQNDKHVVLVAAPCGRCGARKTEALRALLAEPDKLGLFNHLIIDVETAQELL